MKNIFAKIPALLVLSLFLPGFLLLSGCGAGEIAGYNPKPLLLPAHIRKIAIRPFANKTQFFGLEDKLTLRVSQEFLRDGRLPLVNQEIDADGVVVGEIVRYIKEPISYDSNHVVEEYKIWVLINLQFNDVTQKIALWQEPRMEQSYRYFVETQPGGITEDAAREQLWDLFARDIVKRTIEGFGSVSGASERKVSHEGVVPSTSTVPADAIDIDTTPFVVPPSPY